MNSFFYGNQLDREEHKLFPFVCSRLNRDISFEDCSYWQDQSKRSTARVVSQMDLGIRKCYTFETSFYGRHRVLRLRCRTVIVSIFKRETCGP